MKELVCIVCPRGCRLRVDDENGYRVTGNSCPRGAEYGANELQHPTRVLTTTVCIAGGIHRRLPVRTNRPIPKELLGAAMEQAAAVRLRAPVAAAWRGTPDDDEVHLSYGSAPAGHYLAQQTFDLAVHAWDIAASQGRDLPWGDDLEQAVLEFVRTDLAENPAPDLFDPPIPGFDGPGAPARHTALALTGRDPGRWPRG